MSPFSAGQPLQDYDSDWRDSAACRGVDTEKFYLPDRMRGPRARAHEAAAKAICARCPVIRECRRWAVRSGEAWGVWGGLTSDERAAIRQISA